MYFLHGPLDVWKQLGEFKSTGDHVAEEIVTVLGLDGVQNGDCVPDTTQDKENQNVYWNDSSPRGNCIAVCKYVVIKTSVLSWIGESDQFVSAKSGLQNDWFNVRMFALTGETIKLTEFSR